MSKHNIVNAIDIGTSSIKLLIGTKEKNSSEITILAKEEVPYSVGVRKSEIYNPQKIAEILSELKEKIQKSKGFKIKKAVVNIGGPHLFSMKSKGLVSVSRADQKISKEDIERVIQASQAVSLPSNKEILDVVPQEFVIDEEGGIKKPLGLQGIRLEAKVLLICLFSPVLENLEIALAEAEIEVEDIVPSPLASARAVLTPEQKEIGVAVVDIGAGTTSLSVFKEGNLIEIAVFPLGAANITNDIAIGLRTEITTAERVKREFGSFINSPSRKKIKKGKAEISKKDISLSPSFLRKIIRFRVSEILFETSRALKRVSKEINLPAGVILTGQGALLPGLVEFSKQKFELPCHLSGAKGINGAEEVKFSGCAGLLLSGFDLRENQDIRISREGLKEKIKKLFRIFLP